MSEATERASAHLPMAERTVPAMLRGAAEQHGDRELVRFEGVSWSYRETERIAARAAQRLRESYGIGRGDAVALLVRNRPEFLEIVLGTAWLGAVSAPLNVAAKGEQLRHMLANSGASVVFAEEDLVDRVREADASLRIVLVGAPAEAGEGWSLADAAADPVPVGPGDPFAILYTSGTTGLSKGVVCPHAQYYWWAHHNISLLEIEADDVLLTTLPLFHTNALSAFVQALRAGAKIVYETRFSASGFRRSMTDSGATITFLLGAMVPILLTTPEQDDDADIPLDRVLAPGVPEQVADQFAERFGIRLIDGFASTESNFVIGSRAGERRPGWMGTVQEGFEVRVADEHGDEVPDGTPGELLLRAREPYAFSLGYNRMPEATVAAWGNLWLHTGDRVLRNEDGYFKFVDRLKDVIRRRGENISSFEVEEALLRHEAVEAVAVFPVGSDLAEDEVMAAVVVKQGQSLAPEALLDRAQEFLAYFAVPRYVDFVTELPLTENGKVRKFVLRERGVTASTWDREAAGYVLRRD